MSNIAIDVVNLGKKYQIGRLQNKTSDFRTVITDAVTAPFRRAGNLLRGQAYGAAELDEEIWALKNINFQVKHGEVVGIIGRNGAGKSTLLKVLSRITEPSEGHVDIYGRVGALLEVGTGFHQELTGRENVYLNGSILGMTHNDIDRKFDEIVDFAGVEQFIDTPVKHYSSGMRLRLGFSVAAHLEPEILVVDEVLAVGDAEFQKKCLGKMGDVAGEGRTVLFVSHNISAISELCNRAVLLNNGVLDKNDHVDSVIDTYFDQIRKLENVIALSDRVDRKGDGTLKITGFQVFNHERNPLIEPGTTALFQLTFDSQKTTDLKNVSFAIFFADRLRGRVFGLHTVWVGETFETLPQSGTIQCKLSTVNLAPGSYQISLEARVNNIMADYIENVSEINIVSGNFFQSGQTPKNNRNSLFFAQHHWSVVD